MIAAAAKGKNLCFHLPDGPYYDNDEYKTQCPELPLT